ncbi:MAG TPA: hypothetical protein VMX94_07015 [Armatimonadota bacterium]|nr:hypothetical protein [Armatimonadota bacterium]
MGTASVVVQNSPLDIPVIRREPRIAETPQNLNRAALYRRFADKLVVNPDLNRALISFQANKDQPFYRWLKFKEAFSSEFVQYILKKFNPHTDSIPHVLDPFSGAGTTLTTATRAGWQATGIELLPVGTAAIRARLTADTVDTKRFEYHLRRLEAFSLEQPASQGFHFPHLRITTHAFPEQTEQALSAYVEFLNGIEKKDVRQLFWFACFSILEEVSYTRKDGQYLRWDSRSGRALKSDFHKGHIQEFRPAILTKLRIMLQDLKKRNGGTFSRSVEVIEGSCFEELPGLADSSFHLVVTSPPYCNRYDYTRTYALELAFLGYDEEELKTLRQTLLSATVENRTKQEALAREYHSRNRGEFYTKCVETFTNQQALQEVIRLLHEARERGRLNNNSIPEMVENYFFEMNIVIHEIARVLAPGGWVVMVNDNVQYNGEEVPADLILSDFAVSAGLSADQIWVLPKGKGNSSQQMGVHGRNELRKCVYVWSKQETG